MSRQFTGEVSIVNSANDVNVLLNGDNGNVSLRGHLIVFDGDTQALNFDPISNRLTIGASDHAGHLSVTDAQGKININLDGHSCILTLGNNGQDGNLRVRDEEDRIVFDVDGTNARLRVGIQGNEGDFEVQDASGRKIFLVDGGNAKVTIGAAGNEGDLQILDDAGHTALNFDAGNAFLTLGAAGNEGDLQILDDAGNAAFSFSAGSASLTLGANGNDGDLIVRDSNGTDRIQLDGNSGDIKLYGADCAEEFDVAEVAEPGVVMVINAQGKLRASDAAYDRCVAGVVAGAGDLHPGIVLGHTDENSGRLPIALTGRTYCKVDAEFGSIAVGDLLTTSPTPGHAMKASDSSQAFGAVIGKALRPLPAGQGLIPILIALQ
ncbi:MAG: hypothetical protein R3E39_23155 [Anaerolineae bacterium]